MDGGRKREDLKSGKFPALPVCPSFNYEEARVRFSQE